MPHSLPWYPCQHHDIFFTNTSFKYPHINSWLCHIPFKVLQCCVQESRSWFSCFRKFCSSWLLLMCHQIYWPWVLNKWNAFFSKLILSWFCTGKEFGKKYLNISLLLHVATLNCFPWKIGENIEEVAWKIQRIYQEPRCSGNCRWIRSKDEYEEDGRGRVGKGNKRREDLIYYLLGTVEEVLAAKRTSTFSLDLPLPVLWNHFIVVTKRQGFFYNLFRTFRIQFSFGVIPLINIVGRGNLFVLTLIQPAFDFFSNFTFFYYDQREGKKERNYTLSNISNISSWAPPTS